MKVKHLVYSTKYKLKEICPRGNNKVVIYYSVFIIDVYFSL
jgi:hypothetical protein